MSIRCPCTTHFPLCSSYSDRSGCPPNGAAPAPHHRPPLFKHILLMALGYGSYHGFGEVLQGVNGAKG